ncbi:MvdC/MvdD family ATP grasp protein [Streptosporangium vulgare]|uniref:MvdC/MvdD family ATP grasp protein n=1 Tax=Streptosporangium vulgare TaxID=46190 RepID=A0ABV5T6T6_9ACTN
MIISSHRDDSVHAVLPKLQERGVPLLWWDEADYPGASTLTAGCLDGHWCQTLTYRGETYDLSKVRAVWDRRPDRPSALEVPEPSQRAFAEHTAKVALSGAYDLMVGARWMPALPQHAAAIDNKLLHLRRATELGLTVVDTVVTNDPEVLVPVWNRTGGRMITKTLEFRPFALDGENGHLYTATVPRRRLTGRHRLRHGPAILQPNVPKAYELRVTVVGEQVFAARIDSQASRMTTVDWRHYHDAKVGYAAYDLPRDIGDRCVRLVAGLGLSFGALDFIVTPDGRYVFLELNVNGQWAFVELRTGMPISDAIADWLAAACVSAAVVADPAGAADARPDVVATARPDLKDSADAH